MLLSVPAWGQRPVTAGAKTKVETFPAAQVQAGKARFAQNCAFCHGRDATGGESGPNLTHSGIVTSDVHGDKIGDVVRNGRPAGMPKFNVNETELAELVAFLHTQAASSNTEEQARRKITLADLLTGNATAGKALFDGKGRCAECHSVTGDLAGIAKKYDPMKLETRMLYPNNARRTAKVHVPGGAVVEGVLVNMDEFHVSIRDGQGWQHSWPRDAVQVEVQDPAEAHLKLLPGYSDADVHNLFAYLQTLQ